MNSEGFSPEPSVLKIPKPDLIKHIQPRAVTKIIRNHVSIIIFTKHYKGSPTKDEYQGNLKLFKYDDPKVDKLSILP